MDGIFRKEYFKTILMLHYTYVILSDSLTRLLIVPVFVQHFLAGLGGVQRQ